MAIIARETATYTPAPEGAYPARCVSVVDLGTQETDGQFGKKSQRQIHVSWELVGETDGGGQPMTIGTFFTLSLSKKANLRLTLESWRGRAFTSEELAGFDVTKLLNAPCILSVKHQPKADGSGVRAAVAGVMAAMKGQTVPAAETPLTLVELDAPDAATKVDTLPDWLKKRITPTPEWARIMGFTPAPAHNAPARSGYADAKAGTPDMRPFAPATDDANAVEIPF